VKLLTDRHTDKLNTYLPWRRKMKHSPSILAAIFQMLATSRTSPFWLLPELRMTQVVLTTGAIRYAKL